MNTENQIIEITNLLNTKLLNYAESKIISEKIDSLLGFECPNIEKIITNKKNSELNTINLMTKQTWVGLDLQAMQTPYSELLEMIELINYAENQTWVDLGAGYGRMGIMIGFLFKNTKFLGYEIIYERAVEADRIYKKWNLTNVEMRTADIAADDVQIQKANVYFIYDFGSKEDVFKVLEKLKVIAKNQPIKVIARGRAVKNWIMMEFPWLSEVNKPIHFKHWSLFQS